MNYNLNTMSAKYSSYGRARKRVKVAHRMTPYDYAVRSIIFQGDDGPVTGERRNILEGEALMENMTKRASYMASQRHVHSDQVALLGSEVNNNNNLKNALENLRFAGFAVTGFDQKFGVYEQGFMATIGGVNTVINTGDRFLEAGKEVYVLPKLSSQKGNLAKGVVRTKQQFALVQENDAPGSIYKQAVDAIAADAIAPKSKDYLKKFAVGTCIRGGRAGQPIDVVLHANSSTIIQTRLDDESY